MKSLTVRDLWPLEDYATRRGEFRREVMQHKKNRRLALGPDVTLYFEDRLTVKYQVQEMVRIEKLTSVESIESELEAYNPLIPDGSNLKATMMIEFPAASERRHRLSNLVGIEDMVWIAPGDALSKRTYAVADEDLERRTEDKTSSVHFLRFELPRELKERLLEGGTLAIGVDHKVYTHTVCPLPKQLLLSLAEDLQ